MPSSDLNPSFILNGINDTSFGDKPVPAIENNEILVAVKKTGICGSDLHFYCHGRIGITAVTEPMVLGHESAGVVEKVGANVTHLAPGDRVAIEPSAACHLCTECKSGTYHLCQKLRIASVPPHDGTLAKFFRVPGDVAYKLPDNLTFEDGAMIEPLAVAVHAVHTLGKLSSNQIIAVYGCGPVGLLCMAVARAMGAARIVGIDIAPERLAMAKRYAATDVWMPLPKEEGEDMMTYGIRNATAMMQTLLLPPHGPGCIDLVVEASGAEASVMTGVLCAKVGGTFVQVGMGTAVVQVPITALLVKELKLLGSFRYGHGDYPLAISLVASGKIDLKPLVTHRFGFEQALDALHTMRDGKGPDGKPAIKCLISAPGETVAVI